MTDAGVRYAVYWAPPVSHPLWRAGCEWLGRDAGRPLAALRSVAPHDLTRTPRRHGFHAVLKAPLRLGDTARADDFLDAVANLATRCSPFTMPAMQVAWLGELLTLQPATAITAEHPLRRLADACVGDLDGWRMMPSASELERQQAGSAPDPARDERVRRWGCAQVFDHWRMHITLSDAMPADRVALRRHLEQQAVTHFAASLALPLECDALCVFVQAAPETAFVLAHRFHFGEPDTGT